MIGPHSPDPSEVRAALGRILASERFQCCEAQARLLRLAVEKSLAGRRFQPKAEPASLLRARLAEYYASEGQHDAVRIEVPADGLPATFTHVFPPVRHTARRIAVWIPAILIAAGLLTFAASWLHARMASAAVRSLVVLPFHDLTPQADAEWLAPGMTAELIDSLSRTPGMRVIARTSAWRAKDGGHEFGVAAVVESTLQQTGDGILHVALTMTRTSDGFHLWSANFDRPARDLAAAAQAIASALAARLQLPAGVPPRHQPPEQAYEQYLQGRYFFEQATPEALDKAAEYLEQATQIDSRYARAWAWLAIVREYRVAAGLARPNQAMPYSRDAAERAVANDPASGDAHLALGIVKLQYDWDWAGAKEELDRAVESMPGSAFALEWHARWFEAQGRMDEANAEIEKALRLDPLSAAVLDDAAALHEAMNRPDLAVPLAQKAADLNPDDAAAHAALASALLWAGQKDRSRQVVDELRKSAGAAKLAASVLPTLAARMGDPDDARQLLDRAEDLPDEELLPAQRYAELAAAVQDWDRLFSWTEEAYGEHDLTLPYWPWNPLMPKTDARYDAFLAQMNLPAPTDR